MTWSLDRHLNELANCPPSERIGMRDDILAFGVECVAPLVALVATHPDLTSSAASWLEVLANRDPGARTASLTALRRLAAGGTASQRSRVRRGPRRPLSNRGSRVGRLLLRRLGVGARVQDRMMVDHRFRRPRYRSSQPLHPSLAHDHRPIMEVCRSIGVLEPSDQHGWRPPRSVGAGRSPLGRANNQPRSAETRADRRRVVDRVVHS